MRHFLDLESTGADALRLILDEAKRRKQARAVEPVWGMGYTPAECADEAVSELAEASR